MYYEKEIFVVVNVFYRDNVRFYGLRQKQREARENSRYSRR